jgi:hypothetical protein
MRKTMMMTAVLALFGAGACEEENVALPDQGLFSDGAVAAATISGYVWDPEIYLYAFFNCAPKGQQCPLPPLTLPGTPLFSQSLIGGAIVGLFDPLTPTQTMPLPYMAAMPSAADGSYEITNVPLRSQPPFFPVAVVPAPTSGVDGGAAGATYLPTFTAKPIATANSTLCLSQAAGAVGDSGVLEAVAGFMTGTGTPTQVTDLVDPSKHGAVAVWWLWMPGSGSLRVPAFGVQMKADLGTTYQIGWAPPGVLPPFLHQSKRGYFVNNGPPDPMNPTIGVSVTVLGPLMLPPPAVTFTITDPVTDASTGRPWTFPVLPPTQMAPGLITYGELQAVSPGEAAPPSWVCLP